MGLCESRNEAVPKTDCEIMRLPNELLECILLKLSYAQIAKVRQVCLRFRDVGDEILDRKFRSLLTRVESRQAAFAQEEKALPGKPVHSGTGSNGKVGSDSGSSENLRPFDSWSLLHVIVCYLYLLQSVYYPLLFDSKLPQDTRLSSAYFIGIIIDVTHRILRLVRSRWIEKEVMEVHVPRLTSLVDHWTNNFFKRIKPTLMQPICSQPMSRYTVGFWSMVIDIFESIPNTTYEYSITKDIDAGGCYYIEGEYAVDTCFVMEIDLSDYVEKPLTVREQETILKEMFNLARYQCLHSLGQLGWKSPQLSEYEKRRFLPEHRITFDIILKCKKEPAHSNILLEILEMMYCDDNEDESASRAHTVQEPSPAHRAQVTDRLVPVVITEKAEFMPLCKDESWKLSQLANIS